MKSLLTSNLLPNRLQYKISKPGDGPTMDIEGFSLFSRKNHNSLGFTLIELMIVVAILGILAGIGIPTYRNYLEKAKIVTAVAEIKMISTYIEAYRASDYELPADLSDVDFQDLPDPWGNYYQYFNIEAVSGGGAGGGGKGKGDDTGGDTGKGKGKGDDTGGDTGKGKGKGDDTGGDTGKGKGKGDDTGGGEDGGGDSIGEARVDSNDYQINFDYDLYSMGRDGKTNKELSHNDSEDDVIRGKDGSFIGPVSKY